MRPRDLSRKNRKHQRIQRSAGIARVLLVILLVVPAAGLTGLQAQSEQDVYALTKQAWDAVNDFRRGGGQDGEPEHPGATFGPRLWEVVQSLPNGEDRIKAGEEAVHLMIHAGRFETLDQWLSGLAAPDPIWEALLNRLPEAGSYPQGNRMARRQLERLKKAGSEDRTIPAPRIDFQLARLALTAGYGEEAYALMRRLIEEHSQSQEAQRLRQVLEREGVLLAGDAVPAFQLTTVDGAAVTSTDLRDKVLLVDFWSTTCGVCLKDMPAIRALHERLGEQGFEVMGVAFDQDAQAVRRAAESKNADWPQVLASQTDGLPGKMGARGTPYYVLVDAQGRLASPGIGIRFLEQRVEELLSER